MKIVVTGGAGFVGSHFVQSILDGKYPGHEDVRVTVVDKLTYAGQRANLPPASPNLTFVHGDICDQALLAEVVPGHDAVVHFAAESHVDRSVDNVDIFLHTNIVGTQRLLEQCRKARVQRFVHVSTDEVYGSIEQGSWTEQSALEPNSPYAASKAGSDCVARSYWSTYGLNLSITRCCNNYGPRQHTEKVIPRFITRLLDGNDVTLHGDGTAIREWIHVEDHCRAIALVLDKGRAGQTYNIGGGTELTNRRLADILIEIMGVGPGHLRYVQDRQVQDHRYSLNCVKITSELGFEPNVDFQQGITDVVEWYKENRGWWEALPK